MVADSVPKPPKTSSSVKRPSYAACRQPVRVVTKSCYKFGMASHRILIHISRSEHRVLDPDDVYYLRARGGETEIRLRSRTPLVDVRPIGEVAPLFEPFHKCQVRSFVVTCSSLPENRVQLQNYGPGTHALMRAVQRLRTR